MRVVQEFPSGSVAVFEYDDIKGERTRFQMFSCSTDFIMDEYDRNYPNNMENRET